MVTPFDERPLKIQDSSARVPSERLNTSRGRSKKIAIVLSSKRSLWTASFLVFGDGYRLWRNRETGGSF